MSKPTLIIGNKNYSSWSLRPWIFMRQHNIAFNEKQVVLYIETMREELKDYNSDSKVPVLVDGKVIVWDSLSILEYVSEKFLDAKGWPGEQEARAIARSVSAEMHSSFSQLRTELPMNCKKNFTNIKLSAGALGEIERIKNIWRMCRSRYGSDSGWLFAEYSIADAMYAPIALRFAIYNIPLQGIEQAYVETVLNQPCMREWIEAARLEKEIIAAFER